MPRLRVPTVWHDSIWKNRIPVDSNVKLNILLKLMICPLLSSVPSYLKLDNRDDDTVPGGTDVGEEKVSIRCIGVTI